MWIKVKVIPIYFMMFVQKENINTVTQLTNTLQIRRTLSLVISFNRSSNLGVHCKALNQNL